jgi:hypothetical protein
MGTGTEKTLTLVANPNANRPTLTLLGKKPIALAAFKAKLKIVEPCFIPNENAKSLGITKMADVALSMPAKNRPADLSAEQDRAAKPPAAPQPFVEISGQISVFPLSWTTPAERGAAMNRWVARIAREVGKAYETKPERDAAEAFVRGHRLSIANAFQRRLVRKDVVRVLGEMFRNRPTIGE